MSEALEQLAAFSASTDTRRLPADVVEKASACLLYAAAVGIAGTRLPQPRIAAEAMNDGGTGPATSFRDGYKTAPRAAAFANGTLFHARVQDDAHPAGHVGVVVVPAAIAIAEMMQADGDDLLAALVSGYETALRIGRDHTADMSARGFRTTPAYGVYGAAAAAARLMRLDAQKTAHALALAANMAGGLREFSEAGSEDFPYQAGTAASNGILAASLAAGGATGAASALEGAAGFFRAFGERGKRYDQRLLDELGTSFEMMQVTFKPYPICQFHRGVVRGALALRGEAREAPFALLTLRMHPFEADFFGVRYAGPFSTFPQTFMSAPFCAALAWAKGEVTLSGLTHFDAEDVHKLVAATEVVADRERERYSPRLDVQLADGRRLHWEEHERAGAYNLTSSQAQEMAYRLCTEVGVGKVADRLINSVQMLNVADLTDTIARACKDARASN